MPNGDLLLKELVEAQHEWTRAEKLEAIAKFYGDGFAKTMRQACDAELARRAEKDRKKQQL